MPLKRGHPAPPFEAKDQDGKTITSSDLAGQRYVLYFYPHDDTPVCSREAAGFEEAREGLEDIGVPLFGVSPNSVSSHQRFAEKLDLGFRLLADPGRQMVRDFKVEGLLGRVSRVTYIVGPEGRIEDIRKAELSGRGHAKWARERIQELQGQALA